MKSKHIFIYDDCITEDLVIHVVWVGISRREQRAASRVQELAAKTKHAFWSIYNDSVITFLERLAMQIYPSLSPSAARAKFNLCNIRVSTPQECAALMSSLSIQSNVKT